MLQASLIFLQTVHSNTKGKLILLMNSNKLSFEQLFVRDFSGMSSVILIIQFNIFQQEKKKRGRMQHFN